MYNIITILLMVILTTEGQVTNLCNGILEFIEQGNFLLPQITQGVQVVQVVQEQAMDQMQHLDNQEQMVLGLQEQVEQGVTEVL